MSCAYVYNGRNGNKRGAVCGRPESEHCKAIDPGGINDIEDDHDDGCQLSRRRSRRGMVHHTFTRGRTA